jgi:hypothetical protein
MAYMTCTPTGTTLRWRGIDYLQQECVAGPYPATLWLMYRGKKYRPAARKNQVSVFA